MQRLDAIALVSNGETTGAPTRITARFRLAADLDQLAVPSQRPARWSDGLWRRTCFELFVRARSGESYAEVNASPSTEWAAYLFSAYRAGQRPIEAGVTPTIDVARSLSLLEIAVSLPLAALVPTATAPAPATLDVALSAVIEARDGRLSYWALAHPDATRPDFHHPESFVHEIRY